MSESQKYCAHNLSFHLNRAIQIEKFEAALHSQRPQHVTHTHTHRLERPLQDIPAHWDRGDAQSNTKEPTDTRTPELTRPRRMITTSSSRNGLPQSLHRGERNMHVVRGGAALRHRYFYT